MMDPFLHRAHGGMAYGAAWLMDGGQRHGKKGGISHIVEPHDTDIARQAYFHIGKCLNQLCRCLIVRAEDCKGRTRQ